MVLHVILCLYSTIILKTAEKQLLTLSSAISLPPATQGQTSHHGNSPMGPPAAVEKEGHARFGV